MTLEEYLKENLAKGAFDFRLLADISDAGEVSVSIRRGEEDLGYADIDRNIPLDFVVHENDLIEC